MSIILSLIVPVYNMEKYLRQCLESVYVSDMEGFYEVLVVNDGSKDSSIEIAREFEKNYPRTYIVVDKENGGYGSCFNVGVKRAVGKYVKMLDSDDFLDASVFRDYLSYLAKSDADAVINDVIQFDDSRGVSIGSSCECNLSISGVVTSINGKEYRNMLVHNFAFRREIISNVRCPERILYTDTVILFGGLMHSSSICSSGKSIYIYRIGRVGQSVDRNVSISHYQDYVDVLHYVEELFPVLSPKCQCRELLLWTLDNVYYLAMCGILTKTISNKVYSEYKAVSSQHRLYLKKNQIGTSAVNGIILKAVFLPFPVYYVLSFLFRHFH